MIINIQDDILKFHALELLDGVLLDNRIGRFFCLHRSISDMMPYNYERIQLSTQMTSMEVRLGTVA